MGISREDQVRENSRWRRVPESEIRILGLREERVVVGYARASRSQRDREAGSRQREYASQRGYELASLNYRTILENLNGIKERVCLQMTSLEPRDRCTYPLVASRCDEEA